MRLNVHNISHRVKAFPGMPGVTHTVKPGKTIQVDMPDDATPETYKRLAAHGLTFSTIVEEELAATEPPKPAPTPAKEEKPTPSKAKKESQPDTASKEAVTEAPAPLPWQKGLEPPQ